MGPSPPTVVSPPTSAGGRGPSRSGSGSRLRRSFRRTGTASTPGRSRRWFGPVSTRDRDRRWGASVGAVWPWGVRGRCESPSAESTVFGRRYCSAPLVSIAFGERPSQHLGSRRTGAIPPSLVRRYRSSPRPQDHASIRDVFVHRGQQSACMDLEGSQLHYIDVLRGTRRRIHLGSVGYSGGTARDRLSEALHPDGYPGLRRLYSP